MKFLKKVYGLSNKIRVGILNTVFWIFILFLIIILNSDFSKNEKGETLYIQFSGDVIESSKADDFIKILSSRNFEVPENTLLRDVINSIEIATYDNNINSMMIDLDYLEDIGFGNLEEIGNYLVKFKESGKPIYAYSTFFNRSKYYIASFADEICMDPFGEVDIQGISVYRSYLKDALDKFFVDVRVFRAGKYKSYVEPYLSNEMSADVKSQNLVWMNSIWSKYLKTLNNNRAFGNNFVEKYFSNRYELLRLVNGDSGQFALNNKLIDFLEPREEFFKSFGELYYYTDYLHNKGNLPKKDRVAVVTLEGTISYSDNSSGSVSANDFVELLDSINTNEFNGLIVRINSGGGSAFASEVIRRKISTINKEIPVVISMGDVCASGGYWIATAGEKIYSNESTITGSIGVFGLLYGIENTLKNNFGIVNDGVTTTPELEPITLNRNVTSTNSNIIQLGVDNTYNRFLNLVSKSRDLNISLLKNIAEGRVWSGMQGVENGLVDSVTGFSGAKEFFGNQNSFVYFDNDSSLINRFFNTVSKVSNLSEFSKIKELSLFEKIKDPKNIYALWY